MRDKLKKQIASLPPTPGVYVLFAAGKNALWAGAAENRARDVAQFFSADDVALAAEIRSMTIAIKTIATRETDLLRGLRAAIFAYRPAYNLALFNETSGYPVLKLTREKFPRLLVSRHADFANEVETFGAFLPETGVRRRLDFIQRAFRLRTCQIEIDGNLSAPCAEFYFKRCAAPCVKNLCDANEYARRVNDARLLLQDDHESLQARIAARIATAAEALEFERAASLRDLSAQIEAMRNDELWQLNLDDATETFAWDASQVNSPRVHLVTTRGRKTLGAQTFRVPPEWALSAADKAFVFGQILLQHYALYTPRVVRVTQDFQQRRFLQRLLTQRAGRKVAIELIPEPVLNMTANVALRHAQIEWQTERETAAVAQRNAPHDIRRDFKLKASPARMVAFDVAHISGRDTVAATAVWAAGELRQHEYQFWLTEHLGEPDAMQFALEQFLRQLQTSNNIAPDLILVDGGKTQLQRARRALENSAVEIPVVAAVKPPQQHKYIARFLRLPDAKEVVFNPQSSGHWLLQLLRDEAHNHANAVHRARRELSLLTGKLEVAPLLVPTRLDEAGGNAADLQPLAAFTHDGKLVAKRRAAKRERSTNPFAAVRRGYSQTD